MGDALAFDYRLIHRGQANRSLPPDARSRPMLYIVYAKPWFTDVNNFPTDNPLFPSLATSAASSCAAAAALDTACVAGSASADALPALAWVDCFAGGAPCAWAANGARVRLVRDDNAPASASCTWAARVPPPAHITFGGIAGDTAHELLDRATFEQRLGFTLSASLVIGTPELQRGLPLENLAPEDLPDELRPPPSQVEPLTEAVRRAHMPTSHFYVAPDAHGGHGLFAAVPLPRHSVLGEYIGTLRRESEMVGCDVESDPYVMRYPDVSGSLHLSAKDSGSLMRFVNHAPTAHASNNATTWAVLVDGAYHIVIVTTRAVAAREEFAYDYGQAYWARRGAPAEV